MVRATLAQMHQSRQRADFGGISGAPRATGSCSASAFPCERKGPSEAASVVVDGSKPGKVPNKSEQVFSLAHALLTISSN